MNHQLTKEVIDTLPGGSKVAFALCQKVHTKMPTDLKQLREEIRKNLKVK